MIKFTDIPFKPVPDDAAENIQSFGDAVKFISEAA